MYMQGFFCPPVLHLYRSFAVAYNLASGMLLPWKLYRLFDKKQSTYLSNTLVCEREKGYVKNTEITEDENKKNKKYFV